MIFHILTKDSYSSEPGEDEGVNYSDFPNDLAYVALNLVDGVFHHKKLCIIEFEIVIL